MISIGGFFWFWIKGLLGGTNEQHEQNGTGMQDAVTAHASADFGQAMIAIRGWGDYVLGVGGGHRRHRERFPGQGTAALS
jgi:hypothetical protein